MRSRSVLSSCAVMLAIGAMSWAPASAQVGPPNPLGSPCAPGGPTAQYPPSACGLALGRSQVRPGESVTVSGAGFRANTRVDFELRSAPRSLGSAQADSGGSVSASVMIPGDATPGRHILAVTGTDGLRELGLRELTVSLVVLGADTGRGDALPRTGAAFSVPTGIAGAVLVGGGSVAVLAARRRRTAA